MVRKPAKPIIFRISAVSGSSSTSITSAAFDCADEERGLDAETEGPVVGGVSLGFEDVGVVEDTLEAVVAGFWDRGPIGGAMLGMVVFASGSGIGDFAPLGFDGRSGEQVRAPEILSRMGERERERECVRGRSERRAGGSST